MAREEGRGDPQEGGARGAEAAATDRFQEEPGEVCSGAKGRRHPFQGRGYPEGERPPAEASRVGEGAD